MGGKRNSYMILVGKPEGKIPVGRPRYWWVVIIKMDLGEGGSVVWTGFAWLRIETIWELL
jgi:hypothetical protein